MRLQSKEKVENLTPLLALEILKEGNKRFVNNLKINRDLLSQVNTTSEGQYPFAIILSCIDSRTSAELIFDQGLGDIFSVRIAGNVVNEDIIGSLEYACKFAGSKLIVVLGHTNCGAVEGAYRNIEAGSLTGLLSKIKPAIENIRKQHKPDVDFKLISRDIIRENVALGIKQIKNNSPILTELIEKNEIDIVGGIHDISTGEVQFEPFSFDRLEESISGSEIKK